MSEDMKPVLRIGNHDSAYDAIKALCDKITLPECSNMLVSPAVILDMAVAHENLKQQHHALTDENEALREEIERIKQNHGCAREQRTTQFCGEAALAHKEIQALRDKLKVARAALKYMSQAAISTKDQLACARNTLATLNDDGTQ